MKHILLVRSGPYQVDPNSYNLQEIGLAAAFANYGIQCDVVYYHKQKNYDETFKKGKTEVKVLWRKGIRLLRSGIYPELLNTSFLSNYDAVICSEYSQIMSVLFSRRIKTYIYLIYSQRYAKYPSNTCFTRLMGILHFHLLSAQKEPQL